MYKDEVYNSSCYSKQLHSKGDVDDPYVQAELKEIIAKITVEKRTPSPSYSTLIFGEEARRTWIGIGVVSA